LNVRKIERDWGKEVKVNMGREVARVYCISDMIKSIMAGE
jgi:hypothetical protein